MTRKLPCFSTAVVLFTPTYAFALGLGQIELRSALNQVLDAAIEIRSAEDGDLADLSVNLASPQAFAQAGVDRPAVLSDLEFSVETDVGGYPYIRVTSKQPIREPILDFLVELEWSKGRLVREFAVFLDPQPLAVPPPASPYFDVPVPPAKTALKRTPTTPVPTTAETLTSVDAELYGPVASGETLWHIAERFRPDRSFGMQKMMQAILKANPQAFRGGDMNTLLAGSMLQIPTFGDVARRSAPVDQRVDQQQSETRSPNEGEMSAGVSDSGQLRLVSPEEAENQEPLEETAFQNGGRSEIPVVSAAFKINLDGDRLQLNIAGLEDLRTRIGGLVGVDDAALTAIQGGMATSQAEIAFPEVQLEANDSQLQMASPEVQPEAGESQLKMASAEVQSGASDSQPQTAFPEVQLEAIDSQLQTAFPEVQPEAGDSQPAFPEVKPDTVTSSPKVAFPEMQAEEVLPESQTDVVESPVAQPQEDMERADSDAQAESTITTQPESTLPSAVAAKPAVPSTQDLGPFGALMALLKNPGVLLKDPIALLKDPLMIAMLGSGLLVLVLLVALPFLGVRRLKASKTEEVNEPEFEPIVRKESMLEALDENMESEQDLPATGTVTFTPSPLNSSPLERVDLLLAVGNYQDAESTVREALAEDPTNNALVVKLLDILFANSDTQGFLEEAEIMYDRLKNAADPQWEYVAQMGRKLSPNEPLFASVPSDEEGNDSNIKTSLSKTSEISPNKREEIQETDVDPSSQEMEFDIFPRTDEPEQPVQDQSSTGVDDLDWQRSVDEAADSKPTSTDAVDADDDLESHLRSLNFEFDDLLGQNSTEGHSMSRASSVEDDSLFKAEAKSTADGDDLDAHLRSLDFELDGLASADESPTADNEEYQPGIALGLEESTESDALRAELQSLDFDLAELSSSQEDFELDTDTAKANINANGDGNLPGGNDDVVETKLDLAAAYLDMDDAVGARDLLEEVLKDGNIDQRRRAERLLQRVQALKA